MDTNWLEIYTKVGAYWLHDKNPLRPHPILRSGMHSDRFFNGDEIMQRPQVLDTAAEELVTKLQAAGLDIETVDRVVGPAMGAVTLAAFVAVQLGYKRVRPCFTSFCEKMPDESMMFLRTGPQKGENVLIIEDTVTTAGSIEKVAKASTDAGAIVLPYNGVIVNRSGLSEAFGRKIVSLLDIGGAVQFKPDDCPVCRMGSEAIKDAKKAPNWARLTATLPQPSTVSAK